MYKIKLFNKISSKGLAGFDAVKYIHGEDVESPDAILVRSADLKSAPLPEGLFCVARAGAGVNNIPIDKCNEAGIVVFNTPGANANAVKEMAICALLLSSRRVIDSIEWTKGLDGKGADIPALVEKGKSSFTGPELEGKTLGVFGLGATGANTANLAGSFGMEVYGHDPYLTVDGAWRLSKSVKNAPTRRMIYEKSDYIVLHVPVTDETREMINAESIAMMRDGVRIINMSRADLVKDADMAAALESGKVACYVTDFPNENTLQMKNTISIPHLASGTPESEENCAVMAVSQVCDYLENGNIKNSVNLPDVDLPKCGAIRLCVIHKNIPNMLNSITSALASAGINIENMINKSKRDYAYTIVDTNTPITDEIKTKIMAVNGIIRIRVIG